MALLRRPRPRLASEDGSLLIEVLVSAAILLTVAAGVVLVLQTAHAQSALQRSKALATDVAQTKLDQLRSNTYNALRPLSETDTLNQGGVDFTVVSTASPVSQTGAPTGCLNARARDYMNLKTTVTWAKMGKRKPVVLQTMVAAPVGAGGGLVVTVTGAAGQKVPSIPLTLSNGGGSATSDVNGCARWDAVSAGTYDLSTSVPGYVQPNGQQDVNLTGINVAAEETATQSLAYDRGGSVRIRFRQKTTGATGGTNVDTGFLPAFMTLETSDAIRRDVIPVDPAAAPGTDAGATAAPAGLLYPWPSTAYSIYADNCTDAKPTGTGIPTATTSLIPTGGIAPSATTALDLQLPNLNVRVTNQTATTRVFVKTKCGTIIRNLTLLSDGTLKNPGMPFGTDFVVCAYDSASGKKVSRTMDNTSYSAPSATSLLNTMTLPILGSGSCPFTIP
jgi:type II secretory pathway pseudopilin PulG